jgi:hypothetical protein
MVLLWFMTRTRASGDLWRPTKGRTFNSIPCSGEEIQINRLHAHIAAYSRLDPLLLAFHCPGDVKKQVYGTREPDTGMIHDMYPRAEISSFSFF